MPKSLLRTASISCLVLWVVIWILFVSIRLSSFDIRVIPGIGKIMLTALVVAVVAPIVATALAGAALVRQPRVPLNLLTFGCAMAALVGQVALFLFTRWM